MLSDLNDSGAEEEKIEDVEEACIDADFDDGNGSTEVKQWAPGRNEKSD